jgi:hypothetical protein
VAPVIPGTPARDSARGPAGPPDAPALLVGVWLTLEVLVGIGLMAWWRPHGRSARGVTPAP